MKIRIYPYSLILLLLVFSCKREIPVIVPEKPIPQFPVNYALILNEGNFNWGNASASILDLDSNKLYNGVFEDVNGRPLGDVLQSAYEWNGRWYLVVNNSAKIEIVNAGNFESEGTITGFVSPRYFVPVSSTKAYVSDLYANQLWVVDLSSNSIVDSIAFSGPTEEMVYQNNALFVTQTDSNYVYQVDVQADTIVDSIMVGYGPVSMAVSGADHFWVLCMGNETKGDLPRIVRINSTHLSGGVGENRTIQGGISSFNPRIRTNAARTRLYAMIGDVLQFDVSQTTVPTETVLLTQGTKVTYGMGIEPRTGDLYVSDAKGFVQTGALYRYDPAGTPLDSFSVGIIPGEIYFHE